jgi:hypothetical protein
LDGGRRSHAFFILKLSFFPSRFGDWKEERAIKPVLLAMGAHRRIRVLEDIASVARRTGDRSLTRWQKEFNLAAAANKYRRTEMTGLPYLLPSARIARS